MQASLINARLNYITVFFLSISYSQGEVEFFSMLLIYVTTDNLHNYRDKSIKSGVIIDIPLFG